MVLITPKHKLTRKLAKGLITGKLPLEVEKKAILQLQAIHVAKDLKELENPPGNQLKKLKGILKDYHSIRINNQYRIIFIWKDGDAHNTQVIDYH